MRTAKVLFLSVLGTGLSPWAPGTVGSLFSALVYVLFLQYLPCWLNIVLFLIILLLSVKLCEKSEYIFGEKDSSKIVIDEFLGMWLSFLCLKIGFWGVAIGFVVFRFFDIYKPFFIRDVENIGGGWGILLDDLVAGILTHIVLLLIL